MAIGPWHIDINPWTSWSEKNGSTPLRSPDDNIPGDGFIYNNVPAINDAVGWDVPLNAGSWDIYIMYQGGTTSPICSVKLDGTTIGSFDMYRSGFVRNQLTKLSNVVVGSSAVYRLWLACNLLGIGTNYSYAYQHIAISRTV